MYHPRLQPSMGDKIINNSGSHTYSVKSKGDSFTRLVLVSNRSFVSFLGRCSRAAVSFLNRRFFGVQVLMDDVVGR